MIQRKNGRPISALNQNPAARRVPTAPPVYRPGPTPHVLQTKKSAQARANAKPLAYSTPPGVQRQQQQKSLQLKKNEVRTETINSTRPVCLVSGRPTPASSNNRPALIPKVLQRKNRLEQAAANGRVQHQQSSLNNRIIQRAVAVPGPVNPLDQAKQAAAHFASTYSGNDADTDFTNWYEQRGYWNTLPQQAYGVVAEEFHFPIKIRNLDLQLVPLSQALQAIPKKKLPGGISRETKAQLELLVNNYNVKIPSEVGDIFPQYGIRPDQRKHYLRIKTALATLCRFVAALHSSQDPARQHEAMMLKHVGFVDKLLQALSGQLCHNDYSTGLLSTLQTL